MQSGTIEFASKERGRQQTLDFPGMPARNLWTSEPPRLPVTGSDQPADDPNTVYGHQLTHSLGQINTAMGPVITDLSFGRYVGQPDTSAVGGAALSLADLEQSAVCECGRAATGAAECQFAAVA